MLKKPQEVRVLGGVSHIVRQNQTLLITSSDGRCWVQDGRITDDNGNDLNPVPDWFWYEYDKLSPEAKEANPVDRNLHGVVKTRSPAEDRKAMLDQPAPITNRSPGEVEDIIASGEPVLVPENRSQAERIATGELTEEELLGLEVAPAKQTKAEAKAEAKAEMSAELQEALKADRSTKRK